MGITPSEVGASLSPWITDMLCWGRRPVTVGTFWSYCPEWTQAAWVQQKELGHGMEQHLNTKEGHGSPTFPAGCSFTKLSHLSFKF